MRTGSCLFILFVALNMCINTVAVAGIFWETSNTMIVTGSVDAGNVYLENSIKIINKGNLSGFFNVCKGCEVVIENSGITTASFNLEENAFIYQLVNSSDDMNPINVGLFGVRVENADNISLEKLYNLSAGAESLIINNSELILDTNITINNPTLHGDITISVTDPNKLSDKEIMSNVQGEGIVSVYGPDLNPLYRYTAYINDDSLYINFVRDTDYTKIIGGNVGTFLNELRILLPNSDLLQSLDSASDISEINEIISESVRMNPIRLMDSVREISKFEITKFIMPGTELYASPWAVFSDNMNAFGIYFGASDMLNENLQIGASGYAIEVLNDDGFDEYKSYVYGGNVYIASFYDVTFFRIMAGFAFSDFDISPVFDGEKSVNNPFGGLFYFVADLGLNFHIDDKFIVAPFIRSGFDYVTIANKDVFETLLGAGVNVLFDAGGYDINYKYGLSVSADTCGTLGVDFQVRALSVYDKAGGVLDIGVIYDDVTGMGMKIGLSANILF